MKRLLALIVALLASLSVAFAAVNVNTATQAELETLNGIGPVKAKAIVDYRAKNGPFKSLEELDNVPGVGQGTLAKIRNDVTLTGKTSVPADAKGPEKKGAAPATTREPSADDTAKSKAAKAPPSSVKGEEGREQKADKRSARDAGEGTNRAKPSAKESSKTHADAKEGKSKSSKKDDRRTETSK